MKRIMKATGGRLQTTVTDIREEMLGECGEFEEKVIGAERYNLFRKCPKSQTATIIVRGGAE